MLQDNLMKFLQLKKFLIFIAVLSSCNFLCSMESEETLAVRRIATCYYEKDLQVSKRLIEDFFKTYPSSSYLNNLYLLLADLYLQEKEYEKSLALYQLLQNDQLIDESFIHTLHCLYSLKHFEQLKTRIEEKANFISKQSTEDQNTINFYYAEALFKNQQSPMDLETEKKVISIYKTLLNTPFKGQAFLNLAHLHSMRNDHKLASKYFLNASECFPHLKEELLFLAAENQSHFDLSKSSETFYQIKELDHVKSSDAVYNWLVLLFYSEGFDEILRSKDEILEKVPTSKKALTYLILAKSFFNQEKYNEALSYFNESLNTHNLNANEEKEVLFLSTLSSYYSNNLEKFNVYFGKLEKTYKSSAEYPKALFLKAKMFQKTQEHSKAQNFFNKVAKYTSSSLVEASLYESSLCYFLQNQFQKAHDHLSKFLKSFEQSSYRKSALFYLLQSSAKQYSQKPTYKIKNQLIDDYILALKCEGFFETEMLPEVHIKVAKLYFDLQKFQELFTFLNHFIERFPNVSQTYQAHLLFALAYKKGYQDLANYILHLEKAISHSVPQEELSPIYLHLFQAYFQIAKEHDEKKAPLDNLIKKAAEYLFKAVELNYPIPKEHFLWLAHTYFLRLEKIIPLPKNNPILLESSKIMCLFLDKFPQSESSKEDQLRFNYAKVLGLQGEVEKEAEFLKTFIPKLEPSNSIYIQSMLELGICYELLNQTDLAILTYENIISSYSYSIPVITFTAKLRLARILTQSYLSSYSEALFEKISNLYHDLYLSRSLKSEPLHLEAALDNALIQNMASINNLDYKSYLHMLNKLKEDFTLEDNVISKEYHDMRRAQSDKNKVYEAYMMFIDAKILHLQAKVSLQNNELKQAEEKMDIAKKLIDHLQNNKEGLTPYLQEVSFLENEALNKKDIPFDLLSSYLQHEEQL